MMPFKKTRTSDITTAPISLRLTTHETIDPIMSGVTEPHGDRTWQLLAARRGTLCAQKNNVSSPRDPLREDELEGFGRKHTESRISLPGGRPPQSERESEQS
ncbi:hypothetical protein DPEC_G00207640 [Dallia pectoralis]|uniref:Uncharacterized protein n=1 Tax=Dallia pectoralis TaxID=75939 RepID=A0ACC2G5F5_DALPE|nr:hypothetical protein DPEC_G00207640 [Dallia pectoralis]